MKLKKWFGIGRADGNFVLWLFFVVGRGRWGNPRVIWAGGGGRMLMFTLISSLQSPFSIPESARREKRCAFCSGPCRLSGMPYFFPCIRHIGYRFRDMPCAGSANDRCCCCKGSKVRETSSGFGRKMGGQLGESTKHTLCAKPPQVSAEK
jgi:hypothetical protein